MEINENIINGNNGKVNGINQVLVCNKHSIKS